MIKHFTIDTSFQWLCLNKPKYCVYLCGYKISFIILYNVISI